MIIFFKIIKIINVVFYANVLISVLLFNVDLSDGRKYYRNANEVKRDSLKPFVSYLNEDAVFSCPFKTKNQIVVLKKREIRNKLVDNDENDDVQYIIQKRKKKLLKRNAAEDKMENDEFDDKYDDNSEVFAGQSDDNSRIYNLKDMLNTIQNDINYYEKDKLIKYTKRNVEEGLEKLKNGERKFRKNIKSQKREENVAVNVPLKKISEQNIVNENSIAVSDTGNDKNKMNTNRRYTRYLKDMSMVYDKYYETKTIPPLNKDNAKQIENNDKVLHRNGYSNNISSRNVLGKIASKRSDTKFLNLLSSFSNSNNSSSDSVNALLTGLNSFFGNNDLNNSYKSNDIINNLNDNVVNKMLNNTFNHKKVIPLFTPVDNNSVKEPVPYRKLNTSSGYDNSNVSFKSKSDTINKSTSNNKLNRYDDDYENANPKLNSAGGGNAAGYNESNGGDKNVDIELTEKTKPLSDLSKKGISKIVGNSVYKNSDTNNLFNSNFTQTIIELKDKYNNRNNTNNYADLSNKSEARLLMDGDDNLNGLLGDHFNENSTSNVGYTTNMNNINNNNINNNYNLSNKIYNSTNEEIPKINDVKSKKPYSDQPKSNISSLFVKSNQFFLPNFSTRKTIDYNMNGNAEEVVSPYRMKAAKTIQNFAFIGNINNNKKNYSTANGCTSSVTEIMCDKRQTQATEPTTQCQDQNETPQRDANNRIKSPLLKNITVNLTCADEIKVNATINFNYENNSAVIDSPVSTLPPTQQTLTGGGICSDFFVTVTTPCSFVSPVTKPFSDSNFASAGNNNNDDNNNNVNNVFSFTQTQNYMNVTTAIANLTSSPILLPMLTAMSSVPVKISSMQDSILTTVDVLNFDNIHNKVVMNSYNHNKSNHYINGVDNSITNSNEPVNTNRFYNFGNKKRLIATTVPASLANNQNVSDNLHLKIMVENMGGAGGSDFGQSNIKASNSGGADSGQTILKANPVNNTNVISGSNSSNVGPKTLKYEEDYEDEDYIYSNTKSSVASYPTLIVK